MGVGRSITRPAAALLVAAIAAQPPASACPDPVFCQLLLNGSPDRYVVLVFHRGELAGEARRTYELLRGRDPRTRPPANIIVRAVDLDDDPDELMLKVWERENAGSLPWMVVRFPAGYGLDAPVVSRPFTARAVAAVLDSPVRRGLAERILSGHAAVWLLVESGDAAKDAAAAELLDSALKRLNSSLIIDDNVEDFARRMGIEYTLHPSQGRYADMDVEFSMMRLSRADSGERFLLDSLRRMCAVERFEEPVAFAVFARGLVRTALAGESIGPGNIESVCRFLLSPCSCLADPSELGRSCLMTVDWSGAVKDRASIEEAVLPRALSGFTASAQGRAAGEPRGSGSPVVRNVVAVGVLGALLAAAVSALLLRQKRRSRRRP